MVNCKCKYRLSQPIIEIRKLRIHFLIYYNIYEAPRFADKYKYRPATLYICNVLGICFDFYTKEYYAFSAIASRVALKRKKK